jgi:hypothetical protein
MIGDKAMAHFSLPLGAALVVPFGLPFRRARRGWNWRLRALREAAAAGRDGSHWTSGDRGGTVPHSVPAPDRASAETIRD